MQDSRPEITSVFRFERRIRLFVSVYLSAILLLIGCVLITVDMTIELQQVLVVILGLVTVATLDAFKKLLDDKSPIANKFEQIVVRDGGFYVNGSYYINGDINQSSNRKQTLAEAASEIQDLLKQLEQSNPSATEEEKVAYVNEETPPALKSRVASAIKASSDVALDAMLSTSPYSKIATAVLTGWLSADNSSGQDSNPQE